MNRRRYLVAYDIRDDRRLRLVHRRMKEFGYPLQYSVFICDLDAREKITMRSAVGAAIHHRTDSIVIVDLGIANERGSECFEFMGARAHDLPRQEATVL